MEPNVREGLNGDDVLRRLGFEVEGDVLKPKRELLSVLDTHNDETDSNDYLVDLS